MGGCQHREIPEEIRFDLASGLTKRTAGNLHFGKLGKYPLGYKFNRLFKQLEYGNGDRRKIED